MIYGVDDIYEYVEGNSHNGWRDASWQYVFGRGEKSEKPKTAMV